MQNPIKAVSLKRISRNQNFNVISCRSHLVNLIRFQSDKHKNLIWTDSLNEALMAGSSVVIT